MHRPATRRRCRSQRRRGRYSIRCLALECQRERPARQGSGRWPVGALAGRGPSRLAIASGNRPKHDTPAPISNPRNVTLSAGSIMRGARGRQPRRAAWAWPATSRRRTQPPVGALRPPTGSPKAPARLSEALIPTKLIKEQGVRVPIADERRRTFQRHALLQHNWADQA